MTATDTYLLLRAFCDELAKKSPVVRLYLASAVQRLPVEQRADILAGLLSHSEDATDHNLPLMYWYGLESICAAQPAGISTDAT